MNASDQEKSLVLHAADPYYCPSDPNRVITSLREEGLIGDELTSGVHMLGAHFFDLVAFLGCSPVVALATEEKPVAGARVRFQGPEPQAIFYPGADRLNPRCPKCRQPASGWQELVLNWQGNPESAWQCDQCDAVLPLWSMNWRQAAGFARFFIEICGIHPHEAVPSDRLLAALLCVTGKQWSYFYRG